MYFQLKPNRKKPRNPANGADLLALQLAVCTQDCTRHTTHPLPEPQIGERWIKGSCSWVQFS